MLAAERLNAAVRRKQSADKDHPEGSFDLSRDAEGVDVPAAAAPGFDRVISRISASGLLTGQWIGGPVAAALEAWREDGGILDLARFELVWCRPSGVPDRPNRRCVCVPICYSRHLQSGQCS